jgi:muramoyltetrapeptide carboxypeptidase LdcA involved in peptidoglycan recycling
VTADSLLLPPALKKGDTIGVYSPSSDATAFAPVRTNRAVSFLQSKGYKVKQGTLFEKSDFYRSGTIQERVDELNTLIRDPDVRCIMSCIGGSNSNSLLPYIDYEAIKKDPKIFIGYSDVTAILLAIYSKTNVPTFYGPALTASFGELDPLVTTTFDGFEKTLHSESIPMKYALPDVWSDEFLPWEQQSRAKETLENNVQFLGSGIVRGRLIGGNLNTMQAMWASEYMPDILEGDILLIEDSLKSIDVIERLFAMLKLYRVFDKVSAIILGKHELFKDEGTGRQPLDVLTEVLAGQRIPILNNFDCSHTHPMLTMPLGCLHQIDFDDETIALMQPANRQA